MGCDRVGAIHGPVAQQLMEGCLLTGCLRGRRLLLDERVDPSPDPVGEAEGKFLAAAGDRTECKKPLLLPSGLLHLRDLLTMLLPPPNGPPCLSSRAYVMVPYSDQLQLLMDSCLHSVRTIW